MGEIAEALMPRSIQLSVSQMWYVAGPNICLTFESTPKLYDNKEKMSSVVNKIGTKVLPPYCL